MKLPKTYLALVAALVLSAIVVPTALAQSPSPALLQGLETRGQALDNLCGSVTLTGDRYQAVCGTEGARASMTSGELRALEIRGQGMDRLCADGNGLTSDAFAALCTPGGLATGHLTQVIRPAGFRWDDFGIGAGAMFGLALVGGGLVAAAHYSRRSSVRSRPAP
ncbi:MAG TPA: hypothetical protein VFK76_09440 [Gaiellaceae bacterium]|nr:hypothetical protein [Gaiellaceae bacterium]